MSGTVKIGWATAVGLWALSVIGVWIWMTAYACTGQALIQSNSVSTWPHDSSIPYSSNRPTLLLFLHPQCPCSRASLHELQRVLTSLKVPSTRSPRVVIVATLPNQPTRDWFETQSIKLARQLPDSQVHWDHAGVESARFGAMLSGTVRLYSSRGQQLFSGGITISRGHEGESRGSQLLLSVLTEPNHSAPASTPVFGCPLCIETGTHETANMSEVSTNYPTSTVALYQGAAQ